MSSKKHSSSKMSNIKEYKDGKQNDKFQLDDISSIEEKEVDGLLNWAKDLPTLDDKDFKASGNSFFKKGIL